MITQALGGSFTVNHQGNLYRLSPEVTRKLGFQSDAIVFEPLRMGKSVISNAGMRCDWSMTRKFL